MAGSANWYLVNDDLGNGPVGENIASWVGVSKPVELVYIRADQDKDLVAIVDPFGQCQVQIGNETHAELGPALARRVTE